MATLYFKVSSDWEQVVKLRQECEKLEAQLKKMDSRSAPAATKTLETQLESTKQQMMGLVTEAAKAGAEMENDLKRKIDSVTKSSDELSSEIIKQRTIIRETQEDVRRLSEQYSKMGKYSPQSTSTLNQLNKAKAALNEQRYALGELQDQQAKNRLELRQLTREYRDFSQGTDKATVTVDALMSSLKRTAAEIGGLAAIKKFGSDAINATGTMQQLHVALTTILQDGDKASKLISEITQFAAKTPFNLEDVASGAKQLLAYGSSAETVVDELSMLGDVAAGLQIPIGQLIYLYGTLRTQGRAMTVDIRQFAGRGIPIYEELAKVLGVTKDKVGELVTAGEVGFKEVEQAFKNMTSEGGKFNDLMENSAGTWPQRMSNIQDTLFQKLNDFGNKYREVFEFGIGTTEELVEHLDDVISVIGGLIAAYGTYKAALIATAVAQKSVGFVESIRLIMAYRKQLGLATAAQQAFNLAAKSNVYVALLSVLVGLGTAIYMFTKRTKEATAAHEALSNVNKKADKEFSTQAATIDRLNGVLKSETSSLEQKKKALSELQSIIPNYNAKLNEEGQLINNNTEAIKEYLVQLEKQIRLKAAQEELEELYRNKRLQEKNVQTQQSNYDRVREQNPIGVVYGGDAGIEAQRHALNRIADAENALKKANDELKNTQTQIAAIEKEIEQASISSDKSNAPKTTYGEDYEQARKDWEDAKKELQKIEADKNKFTSKQYEDAKKRVETTEKAYKKLGGDTKGKGVKSENQILAQQSRIDELEQKQSQARIRQQVDLENQVAQARINAMADGAEKASAQRELDNKKELEAIERQKEEYKKKVIQSQKEIFDAQEELKTKQNPNYKKRSFDSSSVSVDTSMFDIIYDFTQKKQVNDRIREQERAWNEYLIRYGTFQQKRKAIIEKYDNEIAESKTAGDMAIKTEEKKAALEQLDEQYGKSTRAMADLFEDASEKSVSSIQRIIDKYELLVKYLSGTKQSDNTAVTSDELKDAGFTDRDIEKIEKGEISIKDLTDALKGLKEALKGKSPWQSFISDMQKGIDKLKSADKDTQKIGEGVTIIGDAVTNFAPALGEFGNGIASIFGVEDSNITEITNAISGLGQTASGLGQIMSGDVAGGIMSMAGGVAKAVDAIGKLFGPDGTAYYEKVREQLEAINGTYQKIIDNSKELIQFGGGFASIDAASIALDNYYKKVRNLQRIAEASTRYGADWNSHSAGWHSNKNVGAENFAAMGKIVDKTIDDIVDLTSLTGDELYLIMTQMPEAWSQIDEHIRTALEDIIECRDESDGLKDALSEAVTGISFDSFYNGFIENLSDMEMSAEDFADNFEEYLRKSILASVISNQYKGQIEKLYKDWEKAGKDQVFTEDEVNALRQSQQDLVNQLIEERENLKKTFGWDTEAQEQQSATSKGFETMTQDQASELNGRFTAVAETNMRIEEATDQQTLAITQLSGSISVLISQIYGSSNIAEDTRNILAQSYLELKQINENTGNSAKYLKDIKADIAIVKQNTSRL